MTKAALTVVAVLATGCASAGGWRALRIDGTSESAFDESLALLNEELPYARRQMFALALVDIAQTELQNAEASFDLEAASTYRTLGSRLDGMTYEQVIALADRSGPSIARLYYSRGWMRAGRDANRLLTVGDHALGPRPPSTPTSASYESR